MGHGRTKKVKGDRGRNDLTKAPTTAVGDLLEDLYGALGDDPVAMVEVPLLLARHAALRGSA